MNSDPAAAAFALGGIFAVSVYLGNRCLYNFEKNRNIVNGSYANLLKSGRSDFWHRFYRLGEPSPVILNYVRSRR